jgi:hypothetical protein
MARFAHARVQAKKLIRVAEALARGGASELPDYDTKTAELRGLGMSEEAIAEWWDRKFAEFAEETVEVWEENVDAVAVYQRCQWSAAGVSTAVVWVGIPTTEIEAFQLVDDVRTMVGAAGRILNSRK